MKQQFKDNIKQSIVDTRERRKSQSCKVYEIKFDKSHLSKQKKYYLSRLFLEGKWLYNSILASEDIFNYDTKVVEVSILNKDRGPEVRKLKVISSQMKVALKHRILSSIKGLSAMKKRGRKIGKLKFKSNMNSIPLIQFNMTYKIENENYIKVQGFNKHFKVVGLNQIPGNAEIANANLLRKAGDYYFKVTCFLPKEQRVKTGKVIGLDFGIKTSITDSEGNKFNFQFPETKRIKKASKKLNRTQKHSKNRFKMKVKLHKAYIKNSNKKKDTKNKFVSKLKKDYDVICIQDENIKGWQSSKLYGFGRRVQHSIVGGVISELKKHPETVIIDSTFPSTKLCYQCGLLNTLTLNDRVYSCNCGYSCDRDTHSARNILNEGLKQIDMEYINAIPVEKMLDLDSTIKQCSMKQEAQHV